MPAASFPSPSAWRGFDPAKPELPAACDVIVVYEDEASREQARGVCERLARSFWEEVEFEIDWWRFRYLADPEIGQAAARAAADADVVVVAAQAGHELPAPVRNWMEKWVTRRTGRESVLVALIGTKGGWAADRLPVCAYLRTVAQRAHMDFLAPTGQDFDLGLPLTASASLTDAPPHGDATLPAKPPSHWGLNE
jgi:hypothetical protein